MLNGVPLGPSRLQPKVKAIKRAGAVKRIIHQNDSRLCVVVVILFRLFQCVKQRTFPCRKEQQENNTEKSSDERLVPRNVPQAPSSMFMSYNVSGDGSSVGWARFQNSCGSVTSLG